MGLATYPPEAQQQVLLAFLLGGLMLIGWGSVFRWVCGHPIDGADDLLAACFEGWALLLGALQIWHLFLPVDVRATILAAAVGAGGLVLGTGRAWGRVGRRFGRDLPAVLLAMAAALWLSQLALGGPRHGDAGGYYIPTTLWMQAYPVVVGLGNLSAPYAYNQSYFLYVAAAAVGPFATRPWHVVNSLLVMVLVARGILGWWRLVRPWRVVDWCDLAYALLLPGMVALALGIFFTSPAPDTGVFIVGAALFGSLLQVASGEARTARFHLLAVVLFALAGWTIKVAFAAMAGALLVVVPLFWWWRFRSSRPPLVRTLGVAGAITFFMLAPWIVANVLMSGCPLFPSAVGALDVPWRVRLDVQSWIESDKYMGPLSTLWLDPWWVWRRWIEYGWGAPEVAAPLIAGAGACLAAPFLAVGRRIIGWPRPSQRLPWWIVVPPLVSLAFALRLTPMPRYAGATMWLFGISATLVACGDWLRRAAIGRGLVAGAAVALSVWLASSAPTLWPGLTTFEVPPSIPTDARVLASGLRVNVPRGTDSCYAAPLPCAPHPDPRLRLRRSDDLGGGFAIDESLEENP